MLVILSNPQHRGLSQHVIYLLCHLARFFGALTPVCGIVDVTVRHLIARPSMRDRRLPHGPVGPIRVLGDASAVPGAAEELGHHGVLQIFRKFRRPSRGVGIQQHEYSSARR